ncbi:MAG: uracil-DNA glycosylase [Blastocatellia bacterium]
MNPREDIRDLIAQAREHLRYYSELGLTHIGEISTIIQPPQLVPKSTIIMPTKQENGTEALLFGESSLFGETASPATETPYANETLEDIRRDLGDCQRCKLASTRTNIVFGEGAPLAELMFVGEGPGADEDATGRPFVGRAGQLLTKMIEAIDLKREDVYIANVVKSRPPGNRAPESDEVKACIPFLFRQIAAICPKLIVALGNPAMQALLNTKEGITKMRGHFKDYPHIPGIKVLPTFHPAYLLRSPDKKREAWEDLKKVRAFLRGEIEP